ncbi:MAG: 5-formyltetrahydrofolate cyclo-ligase [Phycisphaera sp.]|nr:5-formyltetrahydrofolate cyclo-ligase [Phycisphaera sp.]
MTAETNDDRTRRALRRDLRARLETVPLDEKRLDPESVLGFLRPTDRTLRVLCYLGDGIEVDLDPLIRVLLANDAEVSVPGVLPEQGRMQPVRLRSLDDSELETDRYGLRTPSRPWSPVDPTELDAILVPGVAFTPAGHRLGRGGGYYDRLLAGSPDTIRRIGICHRVQIVDSLPQRPHDMPVHDLVVVENS